MGKLIQSFNALIYERHVHQDLKIEILQNSWSGYEDLK